MVKQRNELKWGSFLSYLQMGLNIIIGLIYTPLMIRLLGQSEYGLYNTVASTISMLGLLNLGFNSGYIRYYARYRAEEDQESIYKLNGLFLIIFTIIGLIALACGLYLTFHLDLVFKDGLTASEYQIARILMLISTVNLATSFPFSVFGTIIYAHERFFYAKVFGMINSVIGPLLVIPLLLMGYRSIMLVSMSLAVSLVSSFINVYYVFGRLNQKFVFHDFAPGIFASLFSYTAFIAINLVIDQINWNIDKLLLARFKGTTAVAVYSVGYALYGYYMSFSTSISGVFTPRIHGIVSTAQDTRKVRADLSTLFNRVGRIQFLILGLIATGVIFYGKAFILNIWAGAGYEDAYYVALLLILPASIALIQNLGIEIQRAQNLHQFRSIAYLIMALVNLGLSIYLCQLYGAIGSAVGTAISLILANGLIMNIYYHKKCNLDIPAFWHSILRMSPGLFAPIVCGILMHRFLDFDNLIVFMLSIVVYTAIYCVSMWLLAMNESEKELVRGIKRKMLRK